MMESGDLGEFLEKYNIGKFIFINFFFIYEFKDSFQSIWEQEKEAIFSYLLYTVVKIVNKLIKVKSLKILCKNFIAVF